MITGKQRAALRTMSNAIETIFQIGKGGIGENLIKQVDDALNARELIKLCVLETCELTAREACETVCAATAAEPVQTIGRRFTIYRESRDPDKRKIVLQ